METLTLAAPDQFREAPVNVAASDPFSLLTRLNPGALAAAMAEWVREDLELFDMDAWEDLKMIYTAFNSCHACQWALEPVQVNIPSLQVHYDGIEGIVYAVWQGVQDPDAPETGTTVMATVHVTIREGMQFSFRAERCEVD